MNKKILIVRSDTEDAKALSFLLSGTGYRISTHSTANAAMEAARQERYDLAITDRSIPENQKDLGFVANLKETQPKLPVFLLSDKHELDDIINCIRSGVTDIIDEPNNLKRVYETTNEFFNSDTAGEDDVSWDDMMEVERALTTLLTDEGAEIQAERYKKLQEELDATLSRVAELEKSNETLDASKTKTESLLAEIKKRSDEGGGDTSATVERSADLDAREKKLSEREARIAKQKAEAEILLSELEERQFEIEENGDATGGESSSQDQAEIESLQMEWNSTRLDLEAQITDLNRELEQVKVSCKDSEKTEEEMRALNESIQEANETIIEKEFILDQRDKEIETLKAERDSGGAKNPEVEDFEEQKRLFEIERFKLQEKTDRFEEKKSDLEEEVEKRQREIDVNKRDAEVSLRELQNKVKEEQLKLQVDSAAFKDENRQFDQAKQNFQEDIEDLQSKQSELKQFEDRLNRMKTDLDDGKRSLPEHQPSEPEAHDEPKGEVEDEPKAEESDAAPEEAGSEDDKFKPDTWNRPPKKKRGNRGPLRIGRNSSK